MPKYQCDKGHVFLFPSIVHFGTETNFAEAKVCPFCPRDNSHIEEFVEPLPEITSVKSVDLAQVDDYLKQGYTVKELYAKTATLVMLKTVPVDAASTEEQLP